MKLHLTIAAFAIFGGVLFASPVEDWFTPSTECFAASDIDFYYDVSKLDTSPLYEEDKCPNQFSH